MKMKMVTALFVLSLGTTASFAQTGASDGSRFGHGEDSIRCLKNISIYTEYVKTNNFKDAYTPWMSVFTEAPKAQVSTYTNGAKILRALIAGEKDAAKQKQYFNELMKVHDQRIQYLDDLNKLVKRDATKGSIIGMKAHDYFTMGGQDMNEAYNMFKEAIELEKENSDYFVLQEFMDAAARKMKSDEAYKEQFIQDYLFASGVADGALKAATKENDKKLLKVAKDNIDAFFINSGVATCDNLQAIYAPKVEQNKTNPEMVGEGESADAYHITASHPEGLGAKLVMERALADANLKPEDIDYINVHGTSTHVGDISEAKAIKAVFGDAAYKLNISSTKSMTGHLLGAAGAVEAMACVLSVKNDIVPPTINHEEGDNDPELDYNLNFTFNKAQKREVRAALSNTFGFGGHNCCVVFKKYAE